MCIVPQWTCAKLRQNFMHKDPTKHWLTVPKPHLHWQLKYSSTITTGHVVLNKAYYLEIRIGLISDHSGISPNSLDPAAILELFLSRKRGNAGSLCIKHGTLSKESHYITLHHIVSVNSIHIYTTVVLAPFQRCIPISVFYPHVSVLSSCQLLSPFQFPFSVSGLYRYATRTNVSFFDPSPNDQRTEYSCA